MAAKYVPPKPDFQQILITYLGISPLKAHIAVMKAHTECLAYFEELRESKKQQIGLGERDDEDTSKSPCMPPFRNWIY